MKTCLAIIAAATLAVPWSSQGQEVIDGYSILKVCQEDLVLHTSDGVEGGRIGYVVVDPGSQRIVSALVTGGVLAERIVAVPFHSMRFNSAREVTLVDIDRARLTSAPVIERSVLTSTTTRFEPSVFERSYTHFGGNAADLRVGVRSETTSRTDVDRGRDARNRDGRGPDRDRTRPDATDPSRTDRADVPATDRTRPDSTSRRTDRTSSTEAEKNQPSATTTPESRTSESRRGSAQPDSSANQPLGSSTDRRGSANRPDSSQPSSSAPNKPDAASEENKTSRPGASTKPNEERPAASTPGSSPADPAANKKDSGKKDDQAKESPTEKKTPGADSTDPANRRPDRDNPENKGAAQKAGESSASQKENKTPPSTGSESDKKPL